MFGMSFTEILVIGVVAVLFLGPDKLPEAMMGVAKFFKSFKSSINEAKESFEEEMKFHELKQDAKKYTSQLEESMQKVRKKLTFEELDEIKKIKENPANSNADLQAQNDEKKEQKAQDV